VIEVADHQLHNLRVVAGILDVIRVRIDGFERDGAGLALLFSPSTTDLDNMKYSSWNTL
jgi:hypothetical protein